MLLSNPRTLGRAVRWSDYQPTFPSASTLAFVYNLKSLNLKQNAHSFTDSVRTAALGSSLSQHFVSCGFGVPERSAVLLFPTRRSLSPPRYRSHCRFRDLQCSAAILAAHRSSLE